MLNSIYIFCLRKSPGLLLCLLLSLFMLAPTPGNAQGTAHAQAVEQNGTKLLVLENEWIQMTVNPALGGRVSSFLVKKSNREMVTSRDSGLFMDHFYEQNWPGEFLYKPYDAEVLDAGPKQAVVRVSHLSTGNWGGNINNGLSGIQLIRTLTLPADRPVVECEVELKNTDTHSKIFTYWQQNVYRADGDSGAESRQVMTRPSAEGLHVVQPYNDWTRGTDLVAGWTAGVDPKDRVGLVFQMDYNNLWSLYNCGLSSSEYFFDQVLLPGGMSWKTHSTAMLLTGLETVVYASPHLTADIQVSAREGALCVEHSFVAPAAPLTQVKVTTMLAGLNRRPLSGTQPVVSELATIGRDPQHVKTEFPGLAGKPVIIQVSVEGNGWKENYEFPYAGTGSGKEPGKYVDGYSLPKPPQQQQIIKPPVLTKVKNGQPRLLELRGLYYKFWQVQEGANALDRPYDYMFSWYKDIGDIQMLSIPPWDYSEIMKQDVIVFNNIAYGAMVGEQGTGMLKAYVENGGAVLFLGGPQAFGCGNYQQSATLKELLPVELTDAYDLHPLRHAASQNEALKELLPKETASDDAHPLHDSRLSAVRGTPLEAVNWGKGTPVAMWLHELKAKPGAEVWLRAGKQPAIVTQRLGKGRIAVVLLTPLGEAQRGETPYWESPAWPAVMGELLKWLLTP